MYRAVSAHASMSIRGPWDTKLDRAAASEASPSPALASPILHEPRLLQEPRQTGLSYETFYGLKEKPFSLSSDARFFYHSRAHAPAYEDLLASIRRRESLNALTGDIGTGKTTLCRAVLQDLDRKTFSAFVPDPFVSREDLLKVVLMDFGVLSVDDVTSGRLKDASRTELSYLLYEFLDTLTPLQAFAVVIIDEAQNLSPSLLEEIRILSDSDGRERQLQVVLVGQLELRDKLKLPEMRQVDQRISVHCSLEPLARAGIAGYVAHRLEIAGGSPDRVQFSPEAIDVLYNATAGVPRLINRICDRALHHGYLRRAGIIDEYMLGAAVEDAGHFPTVAAAAPPVPPASAGSPQPAVAAPRAAVGVTGPSAAAPAAAASHAGVTPLAPPPPVIVAPENFDAPIDEWLAIMEADVEATRRAKASAPARAPLGPDVPRQERRVARPPVDGEAPPARYPTRPAPQTHAQRFVKRWARRLAVVAIISVGTPVSAIGALALWNLSTDVWELSAPLMVPPVPAALPRVVAPAYELPPVPNIDAAVPPAADLTAPQ
jgi:type II secretory pathway predicted ATPase ExeA